MSMFSPNAWLSRSRLQSNSTADFSKDSLEGLNYLHQQQSPRGSVLMHQQGEPGCNSLFDDNTAGMEKGPRQMHQGSPRSPHSPHTRKSREDDYDDDELLDTFKADISLSTHQAESLSRAQHVSAGPRSHQQEHRVLVNEHGSRASNQAFETTLRKVPSFGNETCISSLSADETNYELDDKTVKSLDAQNQKHSHRSHSQQYQAQGQGPGRHEQQGQGHPIGRQSSFGRDFCGAFDHLNHMINPVDLMGEDCEDMRYMKHQQMLEDNEDLLYMQHQQKLHDQRHQHRRASTGIDHDLMGEACEDMLYMQHQQKLHNQQHQHRRAATALPGPRLLAERPRPLSQQRSFSGTFRPPSISQRSISTSSRLPYSSSSNSNKPVAPHATLRECINITKASDMNNTTSSGHTRVISISGKPQILTARSTSITVLSGSAATVSSGPQQPLGIVWNGQDIDNLTGSSPSSPSSRSFRRSQTIGAYGPDGSTSSPQHGHPSHRSMGSGVSLLTQDMQSASVGTGYRSTNTSTGRSHLRGMSDADSSLVKEERSVMDDRTAVSSSRCSTSTATSRRKKPSFKDEMKFMLKKMVPSPLRKVTTKKNKVNLERSGGCLT